MTQLELINGMEVQLNILIALLILTCGLILGFIMGRLSKQTLRALGVSDWMSSTQFEQTLATANLTTVTLISHLISLFIYLLAAFLALNVSGTLTTELFWTQTLAFLPQLFLSAFTLIVGIVVGDRAKLYVQNYLEQLKLSRSLFLPQIAKYTIIYVGVLLALSQIGIEIQALLALLIVYLAGLLIITVIATKQFLTSGTAGLYLLLSTPYAIGDQITLADRSGIVQETTIFFTTIETDDGTTHKIPNSHIFNHGITVHTTD